MEIVRFNDPRLREVCTPLTESDLRTCEVQTLIKDMNDMVIFGRLKIVGLAANQVGFNLRIVLAYIGCDLRTIINPEFTDMSPEQVTLKEGCLSLPRYRRNIPRSTHVGVKGLDQNGEPLEIRAKNYSARILQHEIDHINGILMTDRQVK
jgi:peptide deformylase